MDDVAEAFVGRCPFVGGGGRRGEPALVDPAAMRAQRIEVFARQLEPAAGHQERPRHPGRGQPQDTLTGIERRAHPRGEILLAHSRPSLNKVLTARHVPALGIAPMSVFLKPRSAPGSVTPPEHDCHVLKRPRPRRKPLLWLMVDSDDRRHHFDRMRPAIETPLEPKGPALPNDLR